MKNIIKKFLFLIIVSFVNSNICYVKVNKNLTTSIIVPCYHGHFKHLTELLSSLEKQTILPNEVVISLSGIEKIPSGEIKALESKVYPFQKIIIKHNGKVSAGKNRNFSCQKAAGDILICQDADDLPHPQRIEIIKYFFENFDIEHLMHRWLGNFELENLKMKWPTYEKANVRFVMAKNWQQIISSFDYLANGPIAITKEAFKKIQWGDNSLGEDVSFNMNAVNTIRKTIIIDARLLLYRNNLSSCGGTKGKKLSNLYKNELITSMENENIWNFFK